MVRSVLITGASTGIGARTAEWLATRGFRVFGTSRNPRPDASGAISWVAMDVRDEASVRKAVAQVLEAEPKLDAVVCNAGYGIFGSIEEVSLDAAQQQFDTNFFGVLRTLRAVIPGMREAGSGRVVLVGSLAGRVPIPFQAHYSATKAAVDNLALALHSELFSSGVRVSLVEPGDINTPFNDAMDWGDSGPSVYGESIRRTRQVIEESLPLAPGPEVVARAIHHALTARRPRVRYAVGREALAVAFARRLLPDRWSLALIRRTFKV
jgi:NAD(P)-dependent dehydrogenase (short-subunit alcohol dehydrogenase family)